MLKFFTFKASNDPDPLSIVKLQNFDYIEGENINPQIIIESPNISLYCLDPQNQQAIFVETPLDIQLSNAPFFYQAQYEYAQRLIAVPLEDLPQLMTAIEEPIEKMIMIYSVGRCGSTLLSKVFNQIETVLSLSEPDVFSQIVGLRNPDGSNDTEIAQLLKICIYLLSKPALKGKQSCCVLKLRSFCIELGDLIYQAFPDSKVIFLYRNAEAVVQSSISAFVYMSTMLPTIAQNIDLYSRFIPLLKEYASDIDFTDSTAIDVYTTAWLSVMQRYRFLQQQGISTCTIRYENLVADPQKIVSAIFDYCGLSLAEVSHACQVFAKDSQSGSNLSKENLSKHEIQIPDILEIRQKVNKLLQKHPEIKTPDFWVPDTLS
ncbi:sulfotransferase family protein [Microcoleus vaginatus]|uniref:sulfotransferase family protein n=1 Tax=Microcoleus vaginatus TaxID=119532 RepID=UPI00403F3C46